MQKAPRAILARGALDRKHRRVSSTREPGGPEATAGGPREPARRQVDKPAATSASVRSSPVHSQRTHHKTAHRRARAGAARSWSCVLKTAEARGRHAEFLFGSVV